MPAIERPRSNSSGAAAALALALAPACGDGVGAQPARSKPDVVLIVVDSLRLDHVGCYGTGSDLTPNIDALAGQGIVWTAAYTQAPWSAPAVAALLASRAPSRLGFGGRLESLPAEPVLLAEALGARGFATAAVVSHPFLGAALGFDQGFDEYVEIAPDGPTAADVTAAALRLFDGAGRRPRFLFVHYADPRPPWSAPEGFGRPARDGYRGRVRPGTEFKDLLRHRDEYTSADRAELRRLYGADVAWTDHHIGALLDGLRARGRYERSVVVLAGSHGFELFDHGGLGDGTTLYDELVRVPLVARLPGSGRGSIDASVSLLDVYPTILDHLELAVAPSLEGISILPGAARVEREHFTETARARRLRAVIDGGWKLIEDLERERYELYDRHLDPREQADLSSAAPPAKQRLEAALRRWAGD